MNQNARLLEMLIGYAAAHQHPFNVGVHLIGIPTIMLGVSIPLTWVSAEIAGLTVTLAHVVAFCMFLFYLTLDALFALAFLVHQGASANRFAVQAQIGSQAE